MARMVKWKAWAAAQRGNQEDQDRPSLELNAQKEALQKAYKTEIDMVKLQLMQEFDSRIFQEVTTAGKNQELCIKQLHRINWNLQEEKKGQEMDMKAYRNTVTTQEEDLSRENKRISELMKISRE